MTLTPGPEKVAISGLQISPATVHDWEPATEELPAALALALASDAFCPYRGFKPYEEADRPFFVGREEDARIIIANLYAAPLTVLYGASGVGKTSVLQAGVLPLLRKAPEEPAAVVLFRTWQTEDFTSALDQAVRKAVVSAGATDEGIPHGLPLDEYLETCAARVGGAILLVFDQFEEYFMYNQASTASVGFEAELARAINRRLPNVRFLFCMREEGLSNLDRFRLRIPHVLGNLLRLEPLDNERAHRAVAEPLDTYSRLREARGLPGMSIEPELVKELLSQEITFDQARRGGVGTLPSARNQGIQLPFLQLVLTRLWSVERSAGSSVLRAETLARMGGANAVVRSHLDAALHRLTPRQRRIAAQTFWYLVTPSLTKVAHTPQDLSTMTGYTHKDVKDVLGRLAGEDVRILRRIDPVPGADGQARYEITHDSLAPAILHWRERFQRRRRDLHATLLAFATLILLFVLVSLYRTWTSREASAQENRVKGEVGLTIARLLLPSNPGASHDAATQALALHWTAAGRDLARRAAFDDRLLGVLRGGHSGKGVTSVAFDSAGTHILSAGDDHALVIWNVSKREPLRRIAGLHRDVIYRAVFSPSGRYISTASKDGTAALWEASNPTAAYLLSRRNQPFLSAAFTRDGSNAILSAEDGRVIVWPLEDREHPRGFRTTWGSAVAIDSDSSGKRIAVASEHSMVSVWNAGSLRREWGVENSGRYVQDAEFAPTGPNLATASRDGIGRVWDVSRGRIVVRLRGHTDWIYDITWSPDGTLLATGSRDGTIRTWDAASGQLIAVLRAGGRGVRSVAFSPDGNVLASAHTDGAIRLWSVRRPARILRAPLEVVPEKKTAKTELKKLANTKQLGVGAVPRGIPGRSETDSIRAMIATPDNRWLIATTDEGAWIWAAGEWSAERLPSPEEGIPIPFFTSDDKWSVIADPQGGISIFPCDVCKQIPRSAAGSP
ncbi:MAG TPA: hypothetical protein VLK84_08020 [Longimicrobium sp.]|nr:hypothetical protein [Longimicrobium sp.]